MATLAEVARDCDATVEAARRQLVHAVREASASGMTQQEIAASIGRSQPEVSRLLRFHGTTPLARKLRAARADVCRAVREVGGKQVRVFGSVARGEDGPGSDIDLLFTMTTPLSLMQLTRLERAVSEIVGAPVDLLPDSALRPTMRDHALAEAIPL